MFAWFQRLLPQKGDFFGMFDVPFAVGREARQRLAETVIEKRQNNAYLEAELNLSQLVGGPFAGDPKVGGRALATLALLEEKKGTAEAMRLAADYYRRLGRDFPDAVLRDGKTGADLLNAVALNATALSFMRIGGGSIAGLLLLVVDTGGVYLVAAGGYLFVILTTALMRFAPAPAAEDRSPFRCASRRC